MIKKTCRPANRKRHRQRHCFHWRTKAIQRLCPYKAKLFCCRLKRFLHLKAKFLLSLLLLLALITISGCWDAKDLEKRAMVVAIGVDKGKKYPLKVTIEIPFPKNLGNGSGSSQSQGGGKPFKVISTEANSLAQALVDLQWKAEQSLFFGDVRVLIVSEPLVKKPAPSLFDSFFRLAVIRKNQIWPLIIKNETAEKLLKTFEPPEEQVPKIYLREMITSDEQIQYIPSNTFANVQMDRINSAKEPFMLAIKQINDSDVKIVGLGTFTGGRRTHLAGFLNIYDMAQWQRAALGQNAGEMFIPMGKGKQMTLQPSKVKRKHHISFRGHQIKDTIDVYVDGEVIETTPKINLVNNKNRYNAEKRVEYVMEKRSDKMVHKLQTFNSDILGIRTLVRSYYPSMYNKIDWKTAFKQADITVKYHVSIKRVGMETS
ncbi:Ger(x)C family germination protein [Scopulibacillus daqui]|uniref:Ger(X)C family germination protein n=1 Tax=Scopulibacillus daqui TaxID=1469162 RepID=A0ABS2PUZ7_9BACL|nr:Ger(x)C family spore germination protein [Scopulibacillus daqui]MBM7643878.1 Ger(x)C family germination protein [Scopulibacillus daqui]